MIKFTEECACGGVLTVEAELDGEAAGLAAVWRADHAGCRAAPPAPMPYLPQYPQPWLGPVWCVATDHTEGS